jgi:hypothetical protein
VDGFGEFSVFYHSLDVQVFYGKTHRVAFDSEFSRFLINKAVSLGGYLLVDESDLLLLADPVFRQDSFSFVLRPGASWPA